MQKNRLVAMSMALMPILVIAIFIGIPALMALAFSLGYTDGPNSMITLIAQNVVRADHGITFQVYSDLLKNHAFQQSLWVTVLVTLCSVFLILLIAWGLAIYMRFAHGWFVHIVSSIYLVPLFIPVVIASYALVTFWNANGYMSAMLVKLGITHFPGFSYTLVGIVIGQIWVNLPFAVLLLASGLQAVPDALIESARDVGASTLRILLAVILPLNMLPTVIVGTFTGIGVLGSFTIPYLIGPTAPNMLGVTMDQYYQSFNQPQQAEAMAVIVFILAAGLGAIYIWANIRSDRKAGAHL
ncbi:ABC transporter permease subunit [Ktedonosporobacter rubrisoli]|uniref:ABC transporter permease subunit n=1 Tax=Ktedonosporobacter rubrisoli TaxID=2509675 RepID=A0A4V0YZ71_KTERU|nr:ABC transporter permease subunit [Ktedonosporobacter rubrisoli]QBD78701.1 ABC transporter permease subunit [Ktedonosporobacter rubrisoli]